MPTHTARFLTIRTAVVAVTAAAAGFAVLPADPTPAAVPQTTAVAAPASAAVSTAPVLSTTPVENVASSSSALSIVMSKIGAPYRYGASGPSAFDCSGLMYWAFKQVGVSLPRTSRAQSAVGTPVAKSALQPGDLVFFYKPVSHVAMYIGNGKVVHASTAGQPVKISNLSSMPFAGARRV